MKVGAAAIGFARGIKGDAAIRRSHDADEGALPLLLAATDARALGHVARPQRLRRRGLHAGGGGIPYQLLSLPGVGQEGRPECSARVLLPHG